MHEEFERYRVEKQSQESKRDVYVSEVEQKLSTLSKNHIKEKNSNGEKIRTLTNSLE